MKFDPEETPRPEARNNPTGWKSLPADLRGNLLGSIVVLILSLLQSLNLLFNGVTEKPFPFKGLYLYSSIILVTLGSLGLIDPWRNVGAIKGLRRWVWPLLVLLLVDLYLAYEVYIRIER